MQAAFHPHTKVVADRLGTLERSIMEMSETQRQNLIFRELAQYHGRLFDQKRYVWTYIPLTILK